MARATTMTLANIQPGLYLSCLKRCRLLIVDTGSSSIVEEASKQNISHQGVTGAGRNSGPWRMNSAVWMWHFVTEADSC